MSRTIVNLLTCFVSAGLLILSFPQFNFYPFAFFGLVPLFYVLDKTALRGSFFYSYITGALFFTGMLYWFIYVTYIGALLIILYCSLYFGLFGIAYFCSSVFKSLLRRILFLSFSWVVIEFLRSNLFSGFGWVSLGYSQYLNLKIIQIADITGVLGVSFLLVLANLSIKGMIDQFRKKQGFMKLIFLNLLIFALVFTYGQFHLNREHSAENDLLNVSVIQANIPQDLKWHEPAWPEILEKYFVLSRQAALNTPELIIWPETAFPGYIGEHDDVFDQLRDFVRELQIPVLLGTVVTDGEEYYNSAVLVEADGEIHHQYNKLHLVPFGEFIPFRSYFPFLSQIVPIADFTSGNDYTLFPVKNGKFQLNALICFEDSVPALSRRFVLQGSDLLVNVTNDAWFHDTKEPFLHLQSSVFRAVENRRAVVRAANTGVSGFIDSTGNLRNLVSNSQGKATYVLGFSEDNVTLNEALTIYTRYGDLFAYLSLICVVFLIFYELAIADRKR